MPANSLPLFHASLSVNDLKRTVDFYTSFFGQAPSKSRPGYAEFQLDKPDLLLAVVENKETIHGQGIHFGIATSSAAEFQKRLEDARSKDHVSKEEMNVVCCYARKDKFWTRDPDGHMWETYFFHEDVELDESDPQFATAEAMCCGVPPEGPRQLIVLSDRNELECCDLGTACL